ncbi:hypothetical protein [Halobacillus litoralis]|uniref:Uncharacterized protein n=1 Tax=Halobacillus litoralis TaxID=45668 RepID=A0A410MJD7_9BACI|nr:hypothetical protein [Halobacillus litoralis]QAS54839.1 hypothetical protein HLI_21545 [Halobacillus litoralis]
MQQLKPIKIELDEYIRMQIFNIEWFNELEDETIGLMKVRFSHSDFITNISIWFDEEDNHYVCLPIHTGENLMIEEDTEGLVSFLVSDILDEYYLSNNFYATVS